MPKKQVRIHPKTGQPFSTYCERCGNPAIDALINLPYSKKYVSLCFICHEGLKAYFQSVPWLEGHIEDMVKFIDSEDQ